MPLRYSHKTIVHLALNSEFMIRVQDVHSESRRENKRQKWVEKCSPPQSSLCLPNVHHHMNWF